LPLRTVNTSIAICPPQCVQLREFAEPYSLKLLFEVFGVWTGQQLFEPISADSSGGIDATGDAYAGNLLGTAVTWSGMTFTLAGPGPHSGLSSTSIPVPTGQYQSLSVLATGVRGNQPNLTFVVTYTDGSTQRFT
jgi:hypothetical protein